MARSRWERMKNLGRSLVAPEMDPGELREAQEKVREAVEETELPKKADWEANAEEAAELDINELADHPLFEEVNYLFEDAEDLPKFSVLKREAGKAAERKRRGLKPVPAPFEGHQMEDRIWVVFRKLMSYHKDLRRGTGNAKAKLKQAQRLYKRLEEEFEALLNARRLAAFEVASEWVEEMDDEIERLEREDRRLRKVSKVERMARRNRRARGGRSTTSDDMEDLVEDLRDVIKDLKQPEKRKKALRELMEVVGDERLTDPDPDPDDDDDEDLDEAVND